MTDSVDRESDDANISSRESAHVKLCEETLWAKNSHVFNNETILLHPFTHGARVRAYYAHALILKNPFSIPHAHTFFQTAYVNRKTHHHEVIRYFILTHQAGRLRGWKLVSTLSGLHTIYTVCFMVTCGVEIFEWKTFSNSTH